MKLVDASKPKKEPGQLEQILQRLQEMLPFGQAVRKSRKVTILRFERALDNRYALLCDIPVPGAPLPVPFILVGPAGLFVFHFSGEKGLFRAKEESWYEMNAATRQFQPARHNLIRLSQTYAKAVSAYLAEHSRPAPDPQPVLMFGNPGVHVDATRPAVRVVLADGVDRFLLSLLQSGETISLPDVRLITETLEKIVRPVEKVEGVPDDIFGKDLGLGQPAARPAAAKTPYQVPNLELPDSVTKKMAFSKRQWLILGALALLSALVMVALILIIVFSLA